MTTPQEAIPVLHKSPAGPIERSLAQSAKEARDRLWKPSPRPRIGSPQATEASKTVDALCYWKNPPAATVFNLQLLYLDRSPVSYNFNVNYGEITVPPVMLKLATLANEVGETEGVTVSQIRGPQRNGRICQARFIFVYLASRLSEHSLASIARFLNGRDHTTIVHALKRMRGKIEIEPKLKAKLTRYETMLTKKYTPNPHNPHIG